MPLLLIGLGNPGASYAQHRHNFGFQVLDAVVAAHQGVWQKRHHALMSEFFVTIGGAPTKVLALKPQDFMNRAGQSSGAVARYLNIPSEDIICLYDELDLPLGKIRHRLGGGAGGHNGIRDLLRHLAGDFHRIRLGIGHPGNKALVQDHVLSNFRSAEKTLVKDVIAETARHCDLLIEKNFAEFMNRLNHLAPKPAPKKPAQSE